jgi:hypothetical protein
MPASWLGRLNRGRHRWLFRLAVLLVVGVGLLLWSAGVQGRKRLTVKNASGQPIKLLKVTAAGKTVTLPDLAPGTEVAPPVGDEGDAPCTVEGQLEDGTRFDWKGPVGQGISLVVLQGGKIHVRPAGQAGPR